MAIFITRKSDDYSIKNYFAIVLLFRQHFTKSVGPQGRVILMVITETRPKLNFQNFKHVLVVCKFYNHPIRNEVSISKTIFSHLYVYVSLKGQITLIEIVCSSPRYVQDSITIFIISKFDEDSIQN